MFRTMSEKTRLEKRNKKAWNLVFLISTETRYDRLKFDHIYIPNHRELIIPNMFERHEIHTRICQLVPDLPGLLLGAGRAPFATVWGPP